MQTPIATISYVPHGVRSLLAEILASKLHNAHSKGMWGAVCLISFAKKLVSTLHQLMLKSRMVVPILSLKD